ncbi:anti-sigma factor [uncultured Corynebacterium sp.]|uniref:anti-sigma factor n=1 Tax=uncultured Corynebacterium sp. TaxID=159447 RepID=UPI0028E72AF8|nr:anti-sigma factor [uncultured Corynebacterium sp.]
MTTKDQSWLPDEKLADTELADALALSTVPVTPSDSLKDTVLAAIDEIEPEGDSGAPTAAVADAVSSTNAAATDPDAAEPADVAAVKADLGGTGGAGEASGAGGGRVINLGNWQFRPSKQRIMFIAAAAAVVALLAGSGFLLPKLLFAPSTGPTNQAMSEIMQSADAQSITMSSSGVRLHLVSSTTMNKAGAMVQGTPEVKKGMGIQVWSVTQAGRIHSAGVIAPEEHKDVWMPFESATAKVILTEEPVAGSAKPTGTILGEMQL